MSNSKPTSTATIQDLPTEILRQIFLEIPISTTPGRSFVSLRAVCKRWSPIIDDCWRRFQILIFHDYGRRLDLRHGRKDLAVNTSNESVKRKTADGFIKHCGPSVKIVLQTLTLPSTPSTIPLVVTECPNLEEFCGSVRSKTEGQQLRDLLDNCDKLKKLKISIGARKVYNFFQRIPTHQLEWFNIYTKNIDDPKLIKYIKATVRHCQVLEYLKIDYMDSELVGLLTTLPELQIINPDPSKLGPYRPFTLYNDELLVSLSRKCQQLTILGLQECVDVTDEGIFALSSLPKLRELFLFNLPNVTGKSLKHFSRIDYLKLVECQAGDAEIIELLRNSQFLRTLSVKGSNITDKTLIAAVQETKRRTNNITLRIDCGQTKTHPEKFQGASPFLQVVQSKAPLLRFL